MISIILSPFLFLLSKFWLHDWRELCEGDSICKRTPFLVMNEAYSSWLLLSCCWPDVSLMLLMDKMSKKEDSHITHISANIPTLSSPPPFVGTSSYICVNAPYGTRWDLNEFSSFTYLEFICVDFVMLMLPAAGLWMRAAVWWDAPVGSTSRVAGVTCATTPVPRVWTRGQPTARAVTPVSTKWVARGKCDVVCAVCEWKTGWDIKKMKRKEKLYFVNIKPQTPQGLH